jgi:hypothetical protein
MKTHLLHKVIQQRFLMLLTLAILLLSGTAQAQYFGQNKVRYKNLKFKVYETPHFHLYYYTKNDSLIKNFAKESEAWYALHQQVFRDTFRKPNPLILYGNSPEFQQTTIINSEIGVGTGGVTEGLKNRVFMPIQEINFQTRHVLGHELVHAFQYHSLIEGDSTNLENIGNLPLWMVEGMAEYLSLGKIDANTAMWMRDAVLNKDIPSLRDLTTNSKYFPYRYGQAFWSFIGSTYGDTTIMPLFKSTAKYGYEYAIRRTFGYDEKTLSSLWKSSLENMYKPYLRDSAQTTPIGTKIIDNVNGGEMNVAPAISPDGKYVAFLSEKELFSIDLFLADAKTGKIIRKLTSKIKNDHIDEFNFIESAGAWSPDSKQFAFSAFSQGRNKLLIINIDNGKTVLEASMDKVEQFGNLTWSPNGKDIAFTGLKDGQSDLFSYNIADKQITQLTNDKYTDFQPSYSSDGNKIVFSTDRLDLDKGLSAYISMGMAVIDVNTKAIQNIDIFPGANNFNAVFDSRDEHIYFLSNRDGFRNLYKYNLASTAISQLTDYYTGISGITENSPALSISNNDELVYSYYRSQRYTLYNAKASEFTPRPVQSSEVDFTAATLPPLNSVGVDIVNKNLENFLAYDDTPLDSIKTIPFRPQFKLDYIASNGVGVSTSRFGTGMSSGVQAIFSDILSRNQIFAAASVNGEIYDFGAQLAYVNQESRWSWGGAISHIPYQSGFRGFNPQSTLDVNGEPVKFFEDYIDIIRIFEESAQAFTFYPFNKNLRVEFGTGVSSYSSRVDRWSTYYDGPELPNGNIYPTYPYYQDKRKISLDEFNSSNSYYNLRKYTVFQLNAALIGDNSFSGIAAPLGGYRYKIGIEQNFGTFTYTAPTIDLRKYVRTKPVTFAGRIYGYGRLGETNNQLFPMFIGYPYLIRGYEANSFYREGNELDVDNNFSIDQLIGNRIAVANFEVRLPFTGPEKLAVVESKFLFSDLNLFFDAGLAWNEGDKVNLGSRNPAKAGEYPDGTDRFERVPALSAGVSARVNVFGYFVLEPYLAFPFNRTDIKKPVFGLTFAPGW